MTLDFRLENSEPGISKVYIEYILETCHQYYMASLLRICRGKYAAQFLGCSPKILESVMQYSLLSGMFFLFFHHIIEYTFIFNIQHLRRAR